MIRHVTATEIFAARFHWQVTRTKGWRPRRLTDGAYQHLDRTVAYPVLDRDDAITEVRLHWTSGPPTNHRLHLVPDFRSYPDGDAPVPLPDIHDVTPERALTDQALWPTWPKLYVVNHQLNLTRGGIPIGRIYGHDKPRGGWIRVYKMGSKVDGRVYKRPADAAAAGWRPRHLDQPLQGAD